jgi:hypothetical protein
VDELVLEFEFACFDSCHRWSSKRYHFVNMIHTEFALSGEESNLYSRLQRPLSCH